ncbi:MAG: HAD-IA family hydrolase [archaeon]
MKKKSRGAIIFDYDGVLADTRALILKIYNEIGTAMGVEDFRRAEHLDMFETDYRKTLAKAGITDPGDIETTRRLYQENLRKYNHLTKPIPNIDKVLSRLSMSFRLGIVSNNIKSEIESKLGAFGILGYFDVVIGDEYGSLKPDPTQLLKCLDMLGETKENAFFIGDMDGDIHAAKNAGLKGSIAVTYGYHSVERLMRANPTYVVDNPMQIIEIVEG